MGEPEALTRMGVPHRIGWGHTWLSQAGPELGAETKIREAVSYYSNLGYLMTLVIKVNKLL